MADVKKVLWDWVRSQTWKQNTEHAIASIAVLFFLDYVRRKGIKSFLRSIANKMMKSLPGVQGALDSEMNKEVDKAVNQMFKNDIYEILPRIESIPREGVNRKQLMDAMMAMKQKDAHAETGQLFAYVYSHDEDFWEFIQKAHNAFMHENALNPMAFPSLRRFETEVVRMAASMFHGDSNVRGTMTSGGTESLLMCIKTYRDRAKELFNISDPEVIMPTTGHPAFDKGIHVLPISLTLNQAAHYFGVTLIHIPVTSDQRADVTAMEKAITKNTILLIGSAPQYPHGIVDPIEELAKVALKHKLPLHVDACIGGFMLPWVKKLGYPVPDFDFAVPGVTSISADLHKYGFAPKGASVLLFKDESYRKHQFFSYSQFPGGLYVSPSMLGTRGGGSIAAAWAAVVSLGESGYLAIAKELMNTSKFIQLHINSIQGLRVIGTPHMTIVAFESVEPSLNVLAVADVMEENFGWVMERQHLPTCIHMTLMPPHNKVKDKFVKDLEATVDIVRKNPGKANEGTAAMYGMVAKIPLPEIVDSFGATFIGKVYS